MKRFTKISVATLIAVAVAAGALYACLPADCILLR